MAKKFFAGQNPIGRRYRPEEGNKLSDLVEIIGVIDAKYVALREDIQPTVYLAASQNANPDQSNTFELHVAAGAPTTVISAHAWVIGNDGDRIESKRIPQRPVPQTGSNRNNTAEMGARAERSGLCSLRD